MWYDKLNCQYITLQFSRNSDVIYSWWNSYEHVLDISKIRISMYIDLLFTSSFHIFIATKFLKKKMFLLWKFDFTIIISTSYLPSEHITSRTSTWLRTFSMVLSKIALFINLNKFFSNSFFVKLKFLLNWMYSRNYGNCANCNIWWIFVMRRSWWHCCRLR